MIEWRLFDDSRSDRLYPLTRLRPASALLLGAETGEERWRRCLGEDALRLICRRDLAPLAPGRVAVEDLEPAAGPALSGGAVWVSDLLLADDTLVARLQELEPGDAAFVGDEIVAWRSRDAEAEATLHTGTRPVARAETSPGPPTMPAIDVRRIANGLRRAVALPEDRWLGGLADLVGQQARLITEDLERIIATTTASSHLGDAQAYRPERIIAYPGTQLDHGVVLDAREGPIVLGPNTQVYPHTWIQGPFYARGDSRLLGGRIGGGSSFGPQCRVRGEVDSSVFLGYVNKAHDGFVGHSYLGEWVNLGALTTTSDLKNNYSEISLKIDGETLRTGVNKLGAFMGDHAKTRIGCLLSTGSVVGVGANLIGDPAVPDAWVPDFSWGAGEGAVEYELQKFLQTAETVMKRRGVDLDEAMGHALRRVYEETAPARRRSARANR